MAATAAAGASGSKPAQVVSSPAATPKIWGYKRRFVCHMARVACIALPLRQLAAPQRLHAAAGLLELSTNADLAACLSWHSAAGSESWSTAHGAEREGAGMLQRSGRFASCGVPKGGAPERPAAPPQHALHGPYPPRRVLERAGDASATVSIVRGAPRATSKEQDRAMARLQRDNRLLVDSARAQARVLARLRARAASLRAEISATRVQQGSGERAGDRFPNYFAATAGGLEPQTPSPDGSPPSAKPARSKWASCATYTATVAPARELRTRPSAGRPVDKLLVDGDCDQLRQSPHRRMWSAQLVRHPHVAPTPSCFGTPGRPPAHKPSPRRGLLPCRSLSHAIQPERKPCFKCKEAAGVETRLRGVLSQLHVVRSDVASSVRDALRAQHTEFQRLLSERQAHACAREAGLASQLIAVEESNKELRGQVGQLDTLAKKLIQAAEIAAAGLALESKSRSVGNPSRIARASAASAAPEAGLAAAALRTHLSTARICIDEQREQMNGLQGRVEVLQRSLSAVSAAIVQALMAELCMITGKDYELGS